MSYFFLAAFLAVVVAVLLLAYTTSEEYNGKVLKNFFDNFKRTKHQRSLVKQIVTGLRSQEWQQSIGSDSICRYRQNGHPEDRTRCAFGWLIPDVLYHQKMEYQGCFDVLDKCPELAELLGMSSVRYEDMYRVGSNLQLVTSLQLAHDVKHSGQSMQQRLRYVLQPTHLFFSWELNRMFA